MHAAALHLLLPFALPMAEVGLTRTLLTPSAYGQLLRRATLIEHHCGTPFQRTLPHETWLSQYAHPAAPSTMLESAPFAPYMLLAEGGTPGAARWTCAQPVNLQIAHDHLVLANPATLALTAHEAHSLLAAAQPTFTAFKLQLESPTPYHWYLSGEALGEWFSTTPLRASGRNIEIWLPQAKTQDEMHRPRPWLKLQNEIQMVWFDHPVNQARAAQGKPTINSIWLSGQGTLQPVNWPFTHLFSNATATRGLGLAAQTEVANLPSDFAGLHLAHDLSQQTKWPSTLIELEHFTQPSITQDVDAQHEAFADLEHNWFAPALQALKNGVLPSIALTLCGETDYFTWRVTRADLRKFWRRHAFDTLFKKQPSQRQAREMNIDEEG